jgi:hypothetical protein
MARRGFWLLFAADAATSLAFAAILWLKVSETLPARDLARGKRFPLGPMQPFQDGLFLAFVCLAFGIASVFPSTHD